LSNIINEGIGAWEKDEEDIRNVDSQDLFYNFNFDEEIKGTSTRVS